MVDRNSKQFKDGVEAAKAYMLRQAAGAANARATGAALFNDNYHPVSPHGSSSLPGPNVVANILASLSDGDVKVQHAKKDNKHKSLLDSVKNGAKDVTHRVLDVLSRGTYASANAALTIEKNKQHHGGAYAGELKGAGHAWLEGLKGHDKTTFRDVFEYDNKHSDHKMGKKELAATAFAADVTLDPTTYVNLPVGKGIKLGAKAIDKVAHTNLAGKVTTRSEKHAAEEALLLKQNKPHVDEVNPVDIKPNAAADEVKVKGPGEIDWSNVTFNPAKDDAHQVAATVIPKPRIEAVSGKESLKNAPVETPIVKAEEKYTPPSIDDIPEAPSIPTQRTTVEQAIPKNRAQAKNPAKDKALLAAKLELQQAQKELNAAKRAANKKVKSTALSKADADRIAVRTAILSNPKLILHETPKARITVERIRKDAKRAVLNGDDAALAKITHFFEQMVAKKASDPTFIRQIMRPIKMRKTQVETSPGKFKDVMVPDVRHADYEDGAITIHDMNGEFKGSHTPKALSDLLSGTHKVGKGYKDDHNMIAGDAEDLDNLYVHGDLADGTFKSLREMLNESNPAAVESAHSGIDPALLERHAKAQQAVKDAGALPDTVAQPASASSASTTVEEAAKNEPVPSRADDTRNQSLADSPAPKDVVEEVLSGERVFDRPVTQLSPEQTDGVLAALKGWADRDILEPLLTGKYPHTTKGGTKRTAAKMNEGIGRSVKGFNEMSQGATLAKNIMSHARTMIDPKLKGAARGAAMREVAMPMMRAAWDALEAMGIKAVSGTREKGFAMALPDILEQVPTDILDTYFFDMSRQIAPSQWVRIGQTIVEHQAAVKAGGTPTGLDREIATILHAPMSRSASSVQAAISNPKGPQNAFDIRKMGKDATPEKIKGLIDARVAKAVRALTDPEVVGKIAEAHAVSAARYAVVEGKKVTSIQTKVIDSIVGKATDPNASPADLIRAVEAASKTATEAAKEVGANADTLAKAKAVADDDIKQVIPEPDLEEIHAATRVNSAFRGPVGKDSNSTLDARRIARATREARVGRGLKDTKSIEEKYLDLDSVLDARHANTLSRIWWTTGQSFSTHMGTGTLRPTEWAAQSHYQQLAHLYNDILDGIHGAAKKAYGANSSAKIIEAFNAARRGTEVDDATKPLVEQIGRAFNQLDGVAERGGITHEHLNTYMVRNGLKDFQFEPFTKASGLDQIKAWDNIDDPLAFLARLHKSLGDASVDITVADSFSSMGFRVGGPGLTKISNRSGNNRIFGLINQDLYYPTEAAHHLATIGKLHSLAETFSKADTWGPLRTFDKVTRGWKTGMTVIRPGFHARNLFSDVTLTFLDGVHDPAHYQRAIRILRTHKGHIKGADNFEYLARLSGELPDELASKTGATFATGRKGHTVKVSDDMMYRLASKEGLMPGYEAYADLSFGEARAVNKKSKHAIVRGVGKYVDAMGRLNEVETNMTRFAHFDGAFKQELGKIKTGGLSDSQMIQLAAKRAAERVRKFHPDGSDMAPFERGVMRRVSMFYSWNRKAIPLITETILRRPGKAMIFDKAMFNTAVGMGIDPESLSTPFPSDTLFPNYITDAFTGPQFKINDNMYRINPGDPVGDTVSQWAATSGEGSDGVREGFASLNPWLRVPLEFSIGKKWSTGTDIADKSDYIDSQIPGINTISSITNRSITGLGDPKASTVLGYGPNGQKIMDESPDANPAAAINWLTGLGVQNITTPSMRKGAQFDLRDALMSAGGQG